MITAFFEVSLRVFGATLLQVHGFDTFGCPLVQEQPRQPYNSPTAYCIGKNIVGYDIASQDSSSLANLWVGYNRKQDSATLNPKLYGPKSLSQ